MHVARAITFNPAGNGTTGSVVRRTYVATRVSGTIARRPTKRVGAQYAAVSAGCAQVVRRCARSEAGVEDAFVDRLPKNVWSCERPGCLG